MKNLYIAEKPSVAREFAKALKVSGGNKDGYIESADSIVTWCVGHLVTMSYPEVYDEALKKWNEMLKFSYTESTFWFDAGGFVFGIVLIAAVLNVLNTVWKVLLMNGEKKLVKAGKEGK